MHRNDTNLPVYKNHIMSEKSIIIMTTEGTKMIANTHPKFKKARNALLNRNFEEVIRLMNGVAKVKIKTKQVFTLKNGVTYFKNEILPPVIAKILQKFVDQNIPATAVINFWLKLKKNPTMSSRDELMLFLEHNGIPLCEDGDFIAYKSISNDYKDCHTGTIDNSPGAKIPKLKYDQVEFDRSVCNSRGYHVCAFSYLPTMRGSGGCRTVECKVNPSDVISVPVDYNNAKMRVCFYQIVREITDKPIEKQENHETLYDETTLQKKSKMRIIIPASFMKKLKVKAGGYASIEILEGEIKIYRGKRGQNVYTVEEDSAIRIAKTMLEKAGILKFKNYKLSEADGYLILKGVK